MCPKQWTTLESKLEVSATQQLLLMVSIFPA